MKNNFELTDFSKNEISKLLNEIKTNGDEAMSERMREVLDLVFGTEMSCRKEG